ncbi:MAG: BBE domain-containing protein [Pseudolabrys sp.]
MKVVQARAVVRWFGELTTHATDELCCLLILRIAPALPFLPEAAHGTPIAAIVVHWTGDPVAGEAALRPIRSLGTPLADTIAKKPFIAHQTMLDAGVPFGRRYYWKSNNFDAVDDRLSNALLSSAGNITSPFSSILLMHLDGAPAKLDTRETAVGMRKARYVLNLQAGWDDRTEDARHIAWARESLGAVQSLAAGNPYVNFLTADETASRGAAAYDGAIYERLRDVKTNYDPRNLFHGAHNVMPRKTHL